MAQNFAPPAAVPPDEPTRQAIAAGITQLRQMVTLLERQGVRDPILADVAIYLKAGEWMVAHQEFFRKETAGHTVAILDQGILRARQASRGESPWLTATGTSMIRAYRSRIDGSLQPYAVTLPAAFGQDLRKSWRVDVVLHGRDSSLTEVKFLKANDGSKAAPANQDWVQIDIYGRGNNAYRWAGETDVWEVLDHFSQVERQLGREGLLDPQRVVVRGFSMGGAGAWHLGLHRPDRWCCVAPGAGFTTTRGYWKDLPDPLPPYQESCLRIYDAVDYAANAFNVPLVSYGGSKDAQLAASQNILARLEKLSIPMELLIAPDVAHAVPPEWRQKWEAAIAPHARAGRKSYPEDVRFTTYTLKYPSCDWINILALDRHYEPTRVEAKANGQGTTVTTTNVKALRITPSPDDLPPVTITIDGQEVPVGSFAKPEPMQIYLEKTAEGWRSVLLQKLLSDWQRQPRKLTGLTGPIDDAFTDAFVCVRPTGTPWNPVAKSFAEAELARFQADWSKYFRGELPIKDDTAITADEIAGKHLILFGDPGSNVLIEQILDRLPLTWTKETLTFAGGEHASAEHLPALIYPNPLNPRRYVVLNSGHTFRREDLAGTNARLFPRLGDYAVLKPTPTEKDASAVEVKTAGLFDDLWQIPAQK